LPSFPGHYCRREYFSGGRPEPEAAVLNLSTFPWLFLLGLIFDMFSKSEAEGIGV
jgi:hypothetical protein